MVKTIDVLLRTSDNIRLSSRFVIPVGSGPHPGLVICHGMPDGRGNRVNYVEGLEKMDLDYNTLAELCAWEGFATLIFNFRGTGASEGNFHPLGWAEDLFCALDWMKNRDEVDNNRVVLMGSSFGAVIAIYVAARNLDVAGLVSFASPARTDTKRSAEELVNHMRDIGIVRDKNFPNSYGDFLKEYEEIHPYNSIHRVSPRPILFVHGEEDEVVSVANAYDLYERALEPKSIEILEKVGHRFRSELGAISVCLSWLRSNFVE